MKIIDVRSYPLSYKMEEPIWDAKYFISQRNCVLVEIKTDEGINGFGEAACFGGPPVSTTTILEKEIKPLILDKNPLDREFIWNEVYQKTMQHGRKGIVIHALSGIDQALWDILGKKVSLPVYKLLGGYKDKLDAYASGGFYSEKTDLKGIVEEMVSYVEEGFKAVKMKVGRLSLKEDIERVKAVRKEIGDDNIKLMIDANGALDTKSALKMARELSGENIFFFEEPVSPSNLEGSALIRNNTDIRIAGYENEFTKFGFKEILMKEAVDIVQADATWCGGITEAKKIADMADAWNKPFAPHAYSSIFSLFSNMHLTAAIPNGLFIEIDQNPNPLRSQLIKGGFTVDLDKEGKIALPQEPGLGIEIDEKILNKYLIK